MALKIQCDYCSEELNYTGAILISPPAYVDEFAFPVTEKIHFCQTCYDKLYDLIILRKLKREVDSL